MTNTPSFTAPAEAAKLLLDASALLMQSGAHTERVKRNTLRIATSLGYEPELFFSHAGITITLQYKTDSSKPDQTITQFRHIEHQGVQLSTVSALSRLSWKAKKSKLSFEELSEEISHLTHHNTYPIWFLMLMAPLGTAGLCGLAGGDHKVILMTALATFCGFIFRHLLLKLHYNPFLTIATTALFTESIAGIGILMDIGRQPELAMATSILFLVPGIPLINSLIDMLHGHYMVGLARGVHGTLVAFSIALGMWIAMSLLGVGL